MICAALLYLAACDECIEGESACRGDGIASCGRRGFTEISFCCAQDGCRDVTIDGLRQAVCSPTSEPDPRCTGAMPIDNICVEGPASLHCNGGFGGHEKSCQVTCVSPEPGIAFCALAAEPDPRCVGRGLARICSNDVIVSCTRDFATEEQPCQEPFGACVLVPDNLGNFGPRCASTEPDPTCAVDSPGRCDGDGIFGCRDGRQTAAQCEHSCYQNPIDSMFPEAFCDSPSCSYE